MLAEWTKDCRYAWRMMIKRPWFSAAIVITLGICIGAVGTVFSVVDAAMLRALPFPEPQRLVQIVTSYGGRGESNVSVSQDGAAWQAIRNAKTVDLAVYAGSIGGMNFSADDVVAYLRYQRVSAGYFRVMGIAPIIGREFNEDEDLPDQNPSVIMLDYNFWRRSFNGDPSIVGKPARVGGNTFQIVGVAGPGIESKFGSVDFWFPLHASTSGEGQGLNYEIVGRLRRGVSWAEADAEIGNLAQPLLQQRSAATIGDARKTLVNLQQSIAQDLRMPLILIMSGTLFVLIIGSVNVSGMLLARAAARRSEVSIRLALGGTRSAIFRQLMIENLVLGLSASALGMIITSAGIAALRSLPTVSAGIGEAGWELLKSARLDWRTVTATLMVSLVASLFFGVFPALQTTDVDLRSTRSGRGVAGGTKTFLRRALPAFQVALAVSLLIGAGLLVRSFAHLWTLNPGFDSTNVVAAGFSIKDSRYPQMDSALRLFDQTIRRLHELPGVESVAVAASLPYERAQNQPFLKAAEADRSLVKLSNVIYTTPEFFDTLRIPLLRGRSYSQADGPASSPVVVVNDAFVRKYYAAEDPIGAQLVLAGKTWQIVGVAGDTQQRAGWGQYGPMAAIPSIYLPAAQAVPGMGRLPNWIIRTRSREPNIQRQVEQIVQGVDPLVPFTSFQTLDAVKQSAFSWQQFLALAMGAAAFLALLLSSIGIYAMISNAVAERTREFGIRMALGSTVTQAIRSAALPGLASTAIGLCVGIMAARLETNLLQGLLWGVTATDRATYLAVGAGVLLIALFASVMPALRLSRLDPAETLRQE